MKAVRWKLFLLSNGEAPSPLSAGGAYDGAYLSVVRQSDNGTWHPTKRSLSAGAPSRQKLSPSFRQKGWSVVLIVNDRGFRSRSQNGGEESS